jgi:hypothetical protein
MRVDNTPAKMPYRFMNTTVTRNGDVITVNGADSIKVDFDTVRDTYSVDISGWYFGKTAGLLGTYDNEPSNDMMTAYNQPTENVRRFVSTWEVGRCR